MYNSTIFNQTAHFVIPKPSLGWADYTLIVLHSLVFVIGTIGNCLVCKYFSLECKGLNQIQKWIVYLAITDLLASILDPAIFITLILMDDNTNFGGDIGCKLVTPMAKVLKTLSFEIVMLINIDRCIAILRPFSLTWSRTKIRVVLLIIIFIAFASNTHHFYYIKINEYMGRCGPGHPGFNYANVLVLLVRDLVFLAVFIVTMLAIRHELASGSQKNDSFVNKKQRALENKKVSKTLVMVSTAFIVLIFPRDFLHIVFQGSWILNPLNGLRSTALLMGFNSLLKFVQSLNSVCNVFIYAKINQKFCRTVRKSIRR
ncbi:histamine H2 receptor-like [Clytia hemisphaerica]|uniref:histamine H2 receptor-like n=1 Tax=Clytia hemisphaerica TaxID=252671 RepID=UPI0034D49C67